MKDEKPVSPAPSAPRPAPVPNPPVAAGAAGVDAAQPVPQPGAVAVAAGQPPALFGGHRGGGKKRLDGLPAGSEEARKADNEKNRLRMAASRAAKKAAALPPPLPGVATPAGYAPAPMGAAAPAWPAAPAGAPYPAGVATAPTFVAWASEKIAGPVKLLTKIADRFRVAALMRRVRRLKIPRELEKELERDFQFKAEAIADFNAALTETLTIELNKHRVAGAEHCHYVTLAMAAGELVHTHLLVVDRLEKFIAEQAAKQAEEQKQAAKN